MRTLSHITRVLAAAASLALPAVTAAQSSKPIIAVLSFDNTSIGGNKSDYDGIGKGIQDLLITDLAGNANFLLVDRERIQRVVEEQNLTKSGAIDPQTAVRLGKILGAHYVIYGAFMNAPGGVILTAHTTDMETSQIQNPLKVNGSANDVIKLISDISNRVGALKLTAKGGARRTGDASTPSSTAPAQASATQSGGTKVTEQVETFAHAIAPSAKPVKMDVATTNLYSKALNEIDKKNTAKAVELLKQVVAAADYPPAREKLNKLQKSGD